MVVAVVGVLLFLAVGVVVAVRALFKEGRPDRPAAAGVVVAVRVGVW